jgi:succinyl-diaminopimelate desuccinylase
MLKNISEIINNYKEEAVKLTSDLVAFKSVLDKFEPNSDAPFGIENKRALEFILDKASKDGFIVKNVDNYAGHIEYGSGEELLGVLGHLDVVPVEEDEWTTPPFKADIRDGKLYARGSIDDKGPVAASYIALKILKDLGFEPKSRIRIILGCDEETGSRCLEHYFKTEEKPSFGFSPDAEFPIIYGEKAMMSYDILGKLENDVIEEFVCGERYNIVPSYAKCKLNINLENEYLAYLKENNYKGEIQDGYYIAYGIASHAMVPQNGLNSSFILMDFLNKHTNSKLAEFFVKYLTFDPFGKKLGYDVYDEDMKELTSNVGVVMVKDNEFKIGVNCRIPLNEHIKVVEDKVCEKTKEFGYTYKVLGARNRHYVDPNGKLVQTLLSVYQEVTGDYENKPFTIGGGTYAREIGNAVAYGPVFVGREDVCHIADEYMILDDFYKAIEVYVKAIYELSK